MTFKRLIIVVTKPSLGNGLYEPHIYINITIFLCVLRRSSFPANFNISLCLCPKKGRFCQQHYYIISIQTELPTHARI